MADLTITRGARLAAAGLLILTLITGAGNLLASYLDVQASQHRWCSTLVTLDDADQHAPPPTSPFGRHLVADFHNLRQEFCGTGKP
jgi:hypothetical protein